MKKDQSTDRLEEEKGGQNVKLNVQRQSVLRIMVQHVLAGLHFYGAFNFLMILRMLWLSWWL